MNNGGSGVPGIFGEAETLGLPEPIIEEIGMRVRFTVYLKEPVARSPRQSRKSPTDVRGGGELGGESGVEHQVLELLKNAELSKSEIARALGKEKPTRYLNDLMTKMLENGHLVYTIPGKPTSRLQKYRLTDQGKVLIQEKGDGNE